MKRLSKADRKACLAYLITRAREDVAVFNWLCFKDKQGNRWETQPFQLEWHRLIDQYDRLVILAPIGHGKTEQIARSWVLRRLGLYPDETGAIVSNTYLQAVKRVRQIAEDIKTNEALHLIFPGLKPEERPGYVQKWTEAEIIVERNYTSKDPSVQAMGLHGALLGARLDWVVLDDPCDQENTRTAKQREKDLNWVVSTLLSRLGEKSKMVVIQTAWHEDDIGHSLARDHGFHLVRYEACDERFQNRLWKSEEYLRRAYKDLGEREWNRALRNIIISDSFARIKWEWIQQGLDRGEGVKVGIVPPNALAVVTGVDLAAGKRENSSKVALCTIALLPDGSRQLIDVWASQMTFPEIISAIKAAHSAYGSEIVTEDNTTQVYVREHLQATEKTLPITGHITTAKKWDPTTGVESIAIELQNNQWIIPSVNGQPATSSIRQFCNELYTFDPLSHTGDMLMACYIARTRIRSLLEARQRRLLRSNIVVPILVRQDEWGI